MIIFITSWFTITILTIIIRDFRNICNTVWGIICNNKSYWKCTWLSSAKRIYCSYCIISNLRPVCITKNEACRNIICNLNIVCINISLIFKYNIKCYISSSYKWTWASKNFRKCEIISSSITNWYCFWIMIIFITSWFTHLHLVHYRNLHHYHLISLQYL